MVGILGECTVKKTDRRSSIEEIKWYVFKMTK